MDFRKIHHKALERLLQQVLRLALEAGAIKLGRVARDGPNGKANASKHKAMSCARMKEDERFPGEEARKWLAQAKATDDARNGKSKSREELPEELSQRGARLKRIREAKRTLEQRARQEAKEDGKS